HATAPPARSPLSLHDALPISFSVERTPEMIRAVLRAGANGYVSKDAPSSQVVAALQAAVQGLTALGTAEAHALSRSGEPIPLAEDRKSTRLNSSHEWISYAVF